MKFITEYRSRKAHEKALEEAHKKASEYESIFRDPYSIVEKLNKQFPNVIPMNKDIKLEHIARLQGQQDVIQFLDGIIQLIQQMEKERKE